ncbi:hypothetical protein IWQ60_004022 [Tieghemiomyces parasiticus]|uniref:GH16 domain-containing protein n=1 Tax=Tieghemiomyces parasiticus TaxID=78921 RepID=A0A9W8A968_9FUNG|nr:hypothetical protein IWQ60_004022 [Tieghemiomyces parasiticus]
MRFLATVATVLALYTSTALAQSVCSTKEWKFNSAADMNDFRVDWCPENAYVENGAMVWRLTPTCGTTVIYPKHMTRGRIEAVIKAGPTSGVVTAFIMQGNSPKDEIDLEWVGKDPHRVQSMYFVNGERVPGDELPGYHDCSHAADMFHTYAIDFSPDSVSWSVDGNVVRTISRSPGQPFPNQADLLRMGVWDGSKNSFWAGVVDWNSASAYYAYMDRLSITEYC